MSDDAYNMVIEEARRLEAAIGLSNGFLEALRDEADWSFVIKAHALIEAAVTHALVEKTGFDKAQEFFSYLELSSDKTGKLALAASIDLLNKDERRFVRALSELRNKFVHDVKNVQMTLMNYVASVSKDKRRELAISFCTNAFQHTPTEQQALDQLNAHPKDAIWSSTVFILFVLQMKVHIARAERESIEHQRAIAGSTSRLIDKN